MEITFNEAYALLVYKQLVTDLHPSMRLSTKVDYFSVCYVYKTLNKSRTPGGEANRTTAVWGKITR